MNQKNDYVAGMLVRHPLKPEWGLGKVLVVDGDLAKVHFKDDRAQDYRALKLGIVALQVAEEQSDPVLDNLPPFNGTRFEVAAKRVTFDDGVKRFLEIFPAAFNDPKYFPQERDFKWEAHGRLGEWLSHPWVRTRRREDLKDFSRLAASIAGRTKLLSHFEAMALKDGLDADDEVTHRFFDELLAFIEAEPDKASFERLASVLQDLPSERGKTNAAKWPVLTIFPFLARPDRFMFLKPEPTKACADRLRFNLQYGAELRWITYRNLMLLSKDLLGLLAPYGARDYIDVQSFMWVIAKY